MYEVKNDITARAYYARKDTAIYDKQDGNGFSQLKDVNAQKLVEHAHKWFVYRCITRIHPIPGTLDEFRRI